MNWGLLWGGLGALFVVMIVVVLIISTDSGVNSHTFNSFWLFILLPLIATISGALVLAGREPS